MAYQEAFFAQIWQMIADCMTVIEPIYNGRVYSIVPPEDAEYPLAVYQSQDLGGVNDDTIGANGWNGIITVRSIATTQEEAHNKLAQSMSALYNNQNPMIVSGYLLLSGAYNVSFFPDKPILFPVERQTGQYLYMPGVLVSVYIKPKVD